MKTNLSFFKILLTLIVSRKKRVAKTSLQNKRKSLSLIAYTHILPHQNKFINLKIERS